MRVISTKILNKIQSESLVNQGFLLFQYDFIKTEVLKFSTNFNADFIIFTSKNAVKSVKENENFNLFLQKKVFCVGKETKKLAENCGFEVIFCTNYAQELVEIISENYPKNSFLFFCGNLRRETIPSTLKEKNIIFEEVLTYKTIKTPIKIEETSGILLFFSPSGVESFLSENKIDKNQEIICIGTTTAEKLLGISENINIAENQTIESMLQLLIEKFRQQ